MVRRLLPSGWEQPARDCSAFRRARYLSTQRQLLRLLLFHAISDGGLRETVAQAKVSGLADVSRVALFKRLRMSGEWMAWLGAALCRSWRDTPRLPESVSLRAIDSTTVQVLASNGTCAAPGGDNPRLDDPAACGSGDLAPHHY